MPTLGTNSANRVCRHTYFIIATSHSVYAPKARTIHRGSQGIKATILCAVFCGIIIAETVFRFEVEIFGHPHLVANSYCFVDLAVTFIRQLAIFACIRTITLARSHPSYRTATGHTCHASPFDFAQGATAAGGRILIGIIHRITTVVIAASNQHRRHNPHHQKLFQSHKQHSKQTHVNIHSEPRFQQFYYKKCTTGS